MILLAALAASCFAQRFTPRQSGNYGSPVGPRREWLRPIVPACWQFIYSRSAVWHYDVGLLGPVIISAVVALLVSNLINQATRYSTTYNSQ